MLRGINQQIIFEDNEDNERFIYTLQKCNGDKIINVYAFCLMRNHVHLLLQTSIEIGTVIKRIASSYAYWYNLKYGRCGHLFQDRFKSEAVETDAYFISVIRYIHSNPVKAGLCKNAEEYKYSSYKDYLKEKTENVDIFYTYSIIGKNELMQYHKEMIDFQGLDMDNRIKRVTDSDAIIIIKNSLGCKSPSDIQLYEISQRNKAIKLLRRMNLSIRQISRLTGISKGVIQHQN